MGVLFQGLEHLALYHTMVKLCGWTPKTEHLLHLHDDRKSSGGVVGYDIIDHAFVVYDGDEEGRAALSLLKNDHRTYVVPFIPTAENLAKWAFEQVKPHIKSSYGNKLRLVSMHVRETPKSWASWRE